MGRYQRTSGAAMATPGVPRRPTDGADGFPGAGKGLIDETISHKYSAATFNIHLITVTVAGAKGGCLGALDIS